MNGRDELLASLRRHQPADTLEKQHTDATIALVAAGNGAFSRAHFAPGHVTASAFIVDRAAGRLLLHHHRRLNRWLQMGGHVEEDESTLAAALREGAEESGLRDLALIGDGIFDIDVHAIPAGKGEPDHHHFDVRYVFATNEPSSIARDAAESNDLAWIALGEAIVLMNEEASSRAIRKLRSLL